MPGQKIRSVPITALFPVARATPEENVDLRHAMEALPELKKTVGAVADRIQQAFLLSVKLRDGIHNLHLMGIAQLRENGER